jgi:ADP-ribose pyrophosphatase
VIEAIRHPGSSAVVPVLENESVVLIRQYRPAIRILYGRFRPGRCFQKRTLWSARRGNSVRVWISWQKFDKFGEILIAPWYSDERIYLFMARELIPCEQKLDEDEILTTHPLPFGQAVGMIDRGEIQDATTIIGIKLAYSIWKRKGNW